MHKKLDFFVAYVTSPTWRQTGSNFCAILYAAFCSELLYSWFIYLLIFFGGGDLVITPSFNKNISQPSYFALNYACICILHEIISISILKIYFWQKKQYCNLELLTLKTKQNKKDWK